LGFQYSELVEPETLDPPVCHDIDDDRILASAVAGQVKCIVTGDNDLLVLKEYAGIDIIRTSDFAAYEVGA